MSYLLSNDHLTNMHQARQKALNKSNCKYCNTGYTLGNIKKHELSCTLNPANKTTCPVCSNQFVPKRKQDGSKTTTCSRSCANTHYRTGPNHGNWNPDRYTSTCFHFHKKECVVCGESLIVEVHHLNENHRDNNPDNLIPLCPTHHQYWHSQYKYIVEPTINKYISDWRALYTS